MNVNFAGDIYFMKQYLLDKKLNCTGRTEIFGENDKIISPDGLFCMVHDGQSVLIYDHGVMTKVKFVIFPK